jgi:hypothetical protein
MITRPVLLICLDITLATIPGRVTHSQSCKHTSGGQLCSFGSAESIVGNRFALS